MPSVMESASSLPHSSLRHKRSGYEPSDTENEWQESPWHEGLFPMNRTKSPGSVRPISPFQDSQRQTSMDCYDNPSVKVSRTSPNTRSPPCKLIRGRNDDVPSRTCPDPRRPSRKDYDNTSRTSLTNRKHSKSPYKPIRNGDDIVASQTCSDLRRNDSPFEASKHREHVSPYKPMREESAHKVNGFDGSFPNLNQNPKFHSSMDKRGHSQLQEVSRASERSNSSRRRSVSAPKPRTIENNPYISSGHAAHISSRSPLPLAQTMNNKGGEGAYARNPSQSDINEIYDMQSTDSIAPGGIFFSRDYIALQKKSDMNNSSHDSNFAPQLKVIPEENNAIGQSIRRVSSLKQIPQAPSASTVLSKTNTSSSYAISQSSIGRISNDSSKLSDSSGKLSKSFRKFASNRQLAQTDAWFSCVRRGSCRKSKSPESKVINEATFIEKAFVVEELRHFWADKYRPRSLSGFVCHKQQAQHLKQRISHNSCPHILFKGPPGSGKKSLCWALLHDIFGDSSWKISHDLRHFHIQETRPVQIVVPLTSSPHHMELDLKSQPKNAIYALMALVKEIAGNHALSPDVSDTSFKADYKVIVLYNVDKVEESLQHLIKWTMDRYMDACKIMLCCEEDTDILDSIKSRCKHVTIDAPVTHEIMEVLLHIAKKENFELSVSFAARIATRSKQNMRRAIMALEACKAHHYPFVDEQPISLGWEEVMVELASEVLADPSPKRLFFIRGKFQKLLVEFVDPKLILQKLVEQFLKGIETSLKRELYYWHAYYNKRLPTGTNALLKLEEFVAKFMSIYRNSTQGSVLV